MSYSLGVSTLDKPGDCEDRPARPLVALPHQLAVGGKPFPALPIKKKRGRPRKPLLPATDGLLRAEDVVEELRSQELKGVREYLKTGNLLMEKKAAVGHGEFLRLFNDHPSPVAKPLGMSSKKAQNLMKVARDPRIRQDFHRLPSDLDTLVALSRLSTESFEAALEDGSVHENLSRAQAKQIVKKAMGGATTPERPRRTAAAVPQGHRQAMALKRVQLALWPLIDSCGSNQDRQLLKSALTAFVKSLK